MFSHLVLLAFAGAAGTLARFAITSLAASIAPGWPLGTWVVNVLGSAAFGIIYGVGAGSGMISDTARLVLCVGFLGSFTTFSGFAHDFMGHWNRGEWLAAALYLIVSNATAILALAGGLRLAGEIVPKT